MKKLISITLAVALLATSLFLLPVMTSASDDIVWDDSNVLLATTNTATNTTVWVGPHADSTGTFNIVGGATRIGSALRGNEIKGTANFISSPILKFNSTNAAANVTKTSVKSFKWDLKTLGYGNTTTRTDAAEGFFFHIGDNADYSAINKWNGSYTKAGLRDIKNCFAVIYSRAGSTDGLKAQAFTVLQPEYNENGECLGLFPIKYTKDKDGNIIPDESSYLLVGDNVSQGSLKQITLTLKENKLTVKWDQSANVDSWVSTLNNGDTKEFALAEASLEGAPSGDFAMYADRASSEKIIAFGAMTLTELASVKKVEILNTENSGTIQWLGTAANANGLDFATDTVSGNLYQKFTGKTNFISSPILEYNIENGMKNVDVPSASDFEWTFTERGKSTTWRRPDTLVAYFFHINKNTEYGGMFDYNGYSGKVAGIKDVKNCFAVVYSYQDTEDGLKGKAFTVLQPEYDSGGNCLGLFPIKYTKNETTGVITPDASAYLYVDDTGLRQEWAKDITLTLKGNLLTVKYNAQQDGKNGQKSFTLSQAALEKLPAGDFAIQHNRDWDPGDDGTCSATDKDTSVYVCSYANMKVSVNYEVGTTENSAVNSTHTLIGGSALTFEKAQSSSGGLVGLMNNRVVFSAMRWDAASNKYASAFVTTKGVTGKQLTDYTLKYNYTVAGAAWNVDALALRVQDSENPNREKGYSLVIQGRSFKIDGEQPVGSVITIQKDRCDSVATKAVDASKMSMVMLDAPLTVGLEYIVEIEVVGSTVKAWLYEASGKKPVDPTITYTDPEAKYKTGDVAFVARDEGYSISDITIKDSQYSTICENWAPELYGSTDNLDLTHLFTTPYTTGVVSMSGAQYRLTSNNTVTTDAYTVKTNGFNQNGDYYLKNFELCYELSFNGKRNNFASVYFTANDYSNLGYELRLDGEGRIGLFKNGIQLKTTKFEFISGFDYQVVVNVKDGRINIYIYLLTDKKPETATLSCTDASPLSAGYIYFGTEKGDFNIAQIAVKTFDKETVKGPTGTIFTKNFEGGDKNLNGLSLSLHSTERTKVMTGSDGNSFLRIVGVRTSDPKDFSGVDALSQVKFGSDEFYNFDFTADIRFKSAFSAAWSYLAIGMHANPEQLRNQAIWFDVAAKGAAAIKLDTKNGMSNNNIVATTGMISGTQQSAFVPTNSQENGILVDNRWHNIKVSVRENTYSLYIDGKFVLSYTDPDNSYEKGALYLYGYGLNYDLDNIKVTNNSTTAKVKNVGKTVYSKAEEQTLSANKKLSKLTGKSVSEFEWQFDYKADSKDLGRTSFLYRVNKDSVIKDNIKNYENLADVFGFTITGTNGNKQTSGLINNAITVFTPNPDLASDGKILPTLYSQETDAVTGEPKGPVVPDASATVSLDVLRWNDGTYKNPGVDADKWMTVNVRLIGNKLTIRVWQTDNKSNTMRLRSFTLAADIVNDITKGDFTIVNGNSGAKVRNMTIRDISDTYKNKTK